MVFQVQIRSFWSFRFISIKKTNNARQWRIKGRSENKSMSENGGIVKPSQMLTKVVRPSENICCRLVKNAVRVFGSRVICKANRSTTCDLLLQQHNAEVFFGRLITGDEKWVWQSMTVQNARQWLSPNEALRSIS